MASKEEIDAGARALAEWNMPNITLEERSPERQEVLRKESRLVLDAAERVRGGRLTLGQVLGQPEALGYDPLIRPDRPE